LTSPQVLSCSIRYLGKTCSLHKPSGPLLLYQISGKDLFPSQALRSSPALSDIWERPVPLTSPQVLSCSIRYLGKTCSLDKPSGPLLLYQISGKDLFPSQALRSPPALSDIWERPVPFTSPQVPSCSIRYLGKTCSLDKPSGPLLLYQISGKDLFPSQALRSSPALSDIWESSSPGLSVTWDEKIIFKCM